LNTQPAGEDGLWEKLAPSVQPGQAFLDQAEKLIGGWQQGRGLPFDEHEHTGAVLLAAADQFLGLGEQDRAKNGERGDVHADSQKRPQRRLVP
jgi:hypothetical protein